MTSLPQKSSVKPVPETVCTVQTSQHVILPHYAQEHHSHGVGATVLQEQRDPGSGGSRVPHFLKEPWVALRLGAGFTQPRPYSHPPSWLSTILAALISSLSMTRRVCPLQQDDGSPRGDPVVSRKTENRASS